MRNYSPITMSELKSLVAHVQNLIGKVRLSPHARSTEDVSAAKDMVQNLSSLSLIDVQTEDFDIKDEQLRQIMAEQKTSAEHAESVRSAIRNIFYQFYHDYLVGYENTVVSHNKARQIAYSLRGVSEWACIKVGYSLMYAADGKSAPEAEDVFRVMVDKSPAATFFCAEIHASGLILNEHSGEPMYDFDEALELLSRNLRPEILARNTTYYVRSAIRYAEVALGLDNFDASKIDFITSVLLQVKTSVFEKKVKIAESDLRKFFSCMTSVLLVQIGKTADLVSDVRVASGLVDPHSARLLLSDISVSSTEFARAVSKVTLD